MHRPGLTWSKVVIFSNTVEKKLISFFDHGREANRLIAKPLTPFTKKSTTRVVLNFV